MNLKNALVLAVAYLAVGSAIPAAASTMSYTCDPGIGAATCNYLNTTIAGLYSSTFTNASANIYIRYGTTNLASISENLDNVSYSSYLGALTANTNKDALQISALSALSSFDSGPYGSGNVAVTDALGTALGFTGLTGVTAAGAPCSFPSAGCYSAVVTITNDPGTPLYYDNLGGSEPSGALDFYGIVENETDQVLGTSSCISTQGLSLADGCSSAGEPSAADLFRYSAPATLVLDSSPSTAPGAYFSYNGGATNGANGSGGSPEFYNTLANGEPYSGFISSSPDCGTNQAIQDAVGCAGKDAGLSIVNDGGGEINILNAVGYDLTSSAAPAPTPEPATLSLLGLGAGVVAVYELRRRRANEAAI